MAVVKYVTGKFAKDSGTTSTTTLRGLNSTNTQANAKEIVEAIGSIKRHTGIKSYTLGSEQTWDYEA